MGLARIDYQGDVLTMLLPLALAATDVSVEVAAGVECVGQQGVVARLERAGVSVVRRSTRLHVTITGTGALIRVRGVRAGTALERDITVSAGDCGAVERVISALIQSWSQAIPRASEATARRDSDAGTALAERAPNEPQRDDGAGARAANEADAGVVRRTLMPVDTRRDARDEPARAERSGAANSGTANSGTTNSGTTNSGTTNSGTTNSGTTNSGTTNSGTTNSGTTNSGTANSGTANSGAANSGTANSGTANSGTTNSGTTNSGTANSGSSNSGSSNSGTTNSGTANSGTANSGTANSGTANSGTANSGTANSGTTSSGTANSGPANSGPANSTTTSAVSESPTDAGASPIAETTADAGATLAESAGPGTRPPFDVALSGGGALGPTPSLAGIGQLNAAFVPGRFGAMVDLGLESARAGTSSVESTSQWASASAVLQFEPLARLRLRAALGLRGFRFFASAPTGVVDARSAVVLSFGGVVTGEVALRIVGPLWVQLSGFGFLRRVAERFVVSNLGTVLELAPWGAGLLLGLSIRGFGE